LLFAGLQEPHFSGVLVFYLHCYTNDPAAYLRTRNFYDNAFVGTVWGENLKQKFSRGGLAFIARSMFWTSDFLQHFLTTFRFICFDYGAGGGWKNVMEMSV